MPIGLGEVTPEKMKAWQLYRLGGNIKDVSHIFGSALGAKMPASYGSGITENALLSAMTKSPPTETAAMFEAKKRVSIPTMQNVQTDPGMPTDPITEEPRTAPAYEQQLVMTDMDRAQAKAILDTEKQTVENKLMIEKIDSANKMANYFEQEQVKQKDNPALSNIAEILKYVSKNPAVNPLELGKSYIEILKGDQDRISGIYRFKTVLKEADGIDINDPNTMKELKDPNSLISQKVIERLRLASKESKSYLNKVSGETTFFVDNGGGNLQEVAKVKTDLSATEKEKQEKEKIRYTAQVGKEFREPRETTAEKVVTAEAIERMKIRVNQDKPLTPAENNARIAESQRIMKDLIDTGVDNARTHPLLKSYYEINPKETSVPYINNDKNVKMVILPTRKGKRITAKDVLNAANTAGLTISQTLRKAGYISD